ncbi:hypothetical protein ACH4VR_31040 [Streptomyces sp. NPDC020883]|uniref:hypothetical protein n=1 Tax=Streptomyces sp. NPDC020883 TaxID=3365099 RepID=UPI0037A8DD8C
MTVLATTKNGHDITLFEDYDLPDRDGYAQATCEGCRKTYDDSAPHELRDDTRRLMTKWAEKHARTCRG